MSSVRAHSATASRRRFGNLAIVALLVGLAMVAGYAQTSVIDWPEPGAARWLGAAVAVCLYLSGCGWLLVARRRRRRALPGASEDAHMLGLQAHLFFQFPEHGLFRRFP